MEKLKPKKSDSALSLEEREMIARKTLKKADYTDKAIQKIIELSFYEPYSEEKASE